MAERTCDGCQAELSNMIRVSCADCDDYDLCIDCFCRGFESKGHKHTHSYRLQDRCSYPIISPDWGGDEEMLLIEGLETYGIGNWEDVASHVVSKTADECQEHYLKYYIDSTTYPLPEKRKMESADVETVKRRRRLNPNRRNINVLPPLKAKVAPSHPANHEIQGYMPGRREFEHEAENDAEHMVKDMIFNEDDGPTETDLKLAVLETYNTKLDIRSERKKFIFDRGLIEFRKLMAAERKKSPKEKEFIQAAKPLARLMTKTDFDSFTQTILAEQQLRERIMQLQEYRRYGITSFRAAEEYEAEKKQRIASVMLRSPFAVTSERVFKQISAANGLHKLESSVMSHESKSSMAASKQSSVVDLSSAEGAEFLSEAERKLCLSMQIHPRAYISIKQAVLKCQHPTIPAQSQISAEKVTKIINFCKSIYAQ